MENEIKPRFIKATDYYGNGDFYINPSYIVTLSTWESVNGIIHYKIEYYNKYKGLVSAGITKDDYEWLVGQKVEQIDERKKEMKNV